MNPAGLAVVGAIGLLALLSSKKQEPQASDDDPDAVKAEADRIVRESREIVQGKRDAYSDDPDTKVSAREAAERTKQALDKVQATNTKQITSSAEDALAIEAARRAAEAEARAAVNAAPPKPQPVVVKPKPTPTPIVIKPQPQPKPTPQPNSKGPPPGVDAGKAKNAAPGLAKHIAAKQYNYERKALVAWQKVAGITPDGVYGPASANALKFYFAKAPKKLFAKSRDGTPYPNTPYPPPEWS